MRVLVTGGAGYLGSTLVPLLLNEGHQVLVYDAGYFGFNALLPHYNHPCLIVVRANLNDEVALKQSLKGIDFIIHLAGLVGFPACREFPELAVSCNVEAARTLNRLRGNRPVLYTSTGSVYGKVEDMCDETVPPVPLTLYGETKLAAEQIFQETGNFLTYRLATAFGLSARMRTDLLINDFSYHAVRDGHLNLYQSHARRTFLHVKDIARAVMHGMCWYGSMKDQIFNVGDVKLNCTKLDVARIIQQYVPGLQINNGQGVDPDMRDYAVNYERIHATGFKVSVTLEQGIKEMVKAFQSWRMPIAHSGIPIGA